MHSRCSMRYFFALVFFTNVSIASLNAMEQNGSGIKKIETESDIPTAPMQDPYNEVYKAIQLGFFKLHEENNLETLHAAYQELAQKFMSKTRVELIEMMGDLCSYVPEYDAVGTAYPTLCGAFCVTHFKRYQKLPKCRFQGNDGECKEYAISHSFIDIIEPEPGAQLQMGKIGHDVQDEWFCSFMPKQKGYYLRDPYLAELNYIIPFIEPIYGDQVKMLIIHSVDEANNIASCPNMRLLNNLEQLYFICTGVVLPEWLAELPNLNTIFVIKGAQIPQCVTDNPNITIKYLTKHNVDRKKLH